MAVSAGTTFDRYEILSLLGAGGMGEVYLALDPRLKRKVALKLLPAQFTQDADRVRRFEQEAVAASSLNHPNILVIYDVGTRDGCSYLVSELLEGETLREQLAQGALPVRKAIDHVLQIANGLAAAHEKGIVHRDLKPENLFVTSDGRVKILDFGLAKLIQPKLAGADVNTEAPTNIPNTEPGVVMGTAGYMSPEQVRGQEADHRSDIFSFGAILYEMLAGKRAFGGDSSGEVLSAILRDEPPELLEVNDKLPPQLERVVRHCLEKKPGLRFQSARDLGFALEALSTSSGARLETAAVSPAVTESAGALRPQRRELLAWFIAVLSLLVTLGLAWAYFTRQPAADARIFKTSILPPERTSFSHLAVSPDGRHLAFTAAMGGKVQLWVRALNASEAKALPATQGATYPFWSPDSRFIGFFADGRLKKIEVPGGLPATLCEAPAALGGTWSREGMILFALVRTGLSRVSAAGGEVIQVTTVDRARQEIVHRSPAFLPDGRHFLYNIRSGRKETRGVYLGSLDGTLKRRLLSDDTTLRYVAAPPDTSTRDGSGWLLFGRDGTLLAQHFDAQRWRLAGEPFLIAEKVGVDPIYTSFVYFSASDNGVLVFDPSVNRQRRQYLWVDRWGKPINPLDVVGSNGPPWLSPDEKRFMADRADPQTGTFDLWLCDLSGANPTRFTFDPANDLSPVWSPDGGRIVWGSNREGMANLYQKAASGAGQDVLLLGSEHAKYPTDWSRDGRLIIYYQYEAKTKGDVWALPAIEPGRQPPGEPKPFPLLRTEADETGAALSPNGRWLAYGSDESGRFEVYVQSFPGSGGKRQVSTGGGNYPRWRRDGRELFYYAADGKMMAAPVESGESFTAGAAESLFEFRAGNVAVYFSPYAVTGDGRRFLLNKIVETEASAPLTVVVNWAVDLKR